MSLIKCTDCGQEISEEATTCVKCGRPQTIPETTPPESARIWDAVIKAKTPINIFALAMMACASVLGYSATKITGCEALTAFTYTIHAFLAVSGMFFLAILFCRKGIYHPGDLSKLSPETVKHLGQDRPGIAALLIVAMILVYAFYQSGRDYPCQGVDSQNNGQTRLIPEHGAPV